MALDPLNNSNLEQLALKGLAKFGAHCFEFFLNLTIKSVKFSAYSVLSCSARQYFQFINVQ